MGGIITSVMADIMLTAASIIIMRDVLHYAIVRYRTIVRDKFYQSPNTLIETNFAEGGSTFYCEGSSVGEMIATRMFINHTNEV